MRYALTSEQARAAEEAAVASGASLADLMERAGSAVAAEAAALAPTGRILVLAGAGNNGGDGWVAARVLHEAGREVSVVAVAAPEAMREPASSAAARAAAAGVDWELAADASTAPMRLRGAALAIDALLGIGAKGAPREVYADLVEALSDADTPVLAVDLPSGVDADTGLAPGPAVRASATVTFSALKVGLMLQPGADLAGEVSIAGIGIEGGSLEPEGAVEVWEWPDYADLVPWPGPEAHKGSRGRVLVVGGSPGLSGAACLASWGAQRAGSGYVTAAVPELLLPVFETKMTSVVKAPLPCGPDGVLGAEAVARALELSSRADAVVLGPGLGRGEQPAAFVAAFASRHRGPLLLDADALHAIGELPGPLAKRGTATVLTPHAGEAARLLGVQADAVLADRPAAAREIAARSGGVCVLKGPRTLISDGSRTVVTMTGRPALATAGTGDVLAGVTGAFLAAGLEPIDAAALAARVHGAAGDAAAVRLSDLGCTAEDVLTYLGEALLALAYT